MNTDHQDPATRAQAARTLIDRRLRVLPDGELRSFWRHVASLYALRATQGDDRSEAPRRSAAIVDLRAYRRAA